MGLQNVDTTHTIVFHAGTKLDNERVLTSGGRVIAFTSMDKDYKTAIKKSYDEIKKICFEDMYFRTDIGFDL
jgi:phosphoribosylamine--glycine ligase